MHVCESRFFQVGATPNNLLLEAVEAGDVYAHPIFQLPQPKPITLANRQ